jgi:hypothetical protein
MAQSGTLWPVSLPAFEDDSFCFAPIVVPDGGGAHVSAVAGAARKA